MPSNKQYEQTEIFNEALHPSDEPEEIEEQNHDELVSADDSDPSSHLDKHDAQPVKALTSPVSDQYALTSFQDTGSFEKYVQSANLAPKLSSEEEWELAHRIHEYNDLEAAQKLVFSNLRYVIAIAQTYSGYGLPLPDLVQEGNLGLMRAVKRFQPEKK